jgi:autotransporter-associated beta strand protein
VIDDSLVETAETVQLVLSTASNAALSTTSTHTFTITDDDTPAITLTAPDAIANEAGDTGTFTFSRNGVTTSALTVNFTRSGSATTGAGNSTDDFTNVITPGTVTFGIGEATKTVTVTPLQNTANEANETVILTLNTGSGYTIGSPSTATVTIEDDDVNTITLTANNTYSGGTTVTSGTLAGTTSSLQGNIFNNSVVNFSQSTEGTYAGSMSGTGSLTKTGNGTLIVADTRDSIKIPSLRIIGQSSA